MQRTIVFSLLMCVAASGFSLHGMHYAKDRLTFSNVAGFVCGIPLAQALDCMPAAIGSVTNSFAKTYLSHTGIGAIGGLAIWIGYSCYSFTNNMKKHKAIQILHVAQKAGYLKTIGRVIWHTPLPAAALTVGGLALCRNIFG